MYDAAAASWTLAETATGMGELAPWAQVAATVVITGLFIWTIVYRDPAERGENRKELGAARSEFLKELAEERKSRESANEKFMVMVTENRERSHSQRMEDRKAYQDSTRVMLQEFLGAVREIRNGNP